MKAKSVVQIGEQHEIFLPLSVAVIAASEDQHQREAQFSVGGKKQLPAIVRGRFKQQPVTSAWDGGKGGKLQVECRVGSDGIDLGSHQGMIPMGSH